MAETSKKSSNTALWVLGGMMIFLLAGCMFTFAAGVWMYSGDTGNLRPVSARPIEPATVVSQPVVALPTPRVIIEAPENGMDYETAVLANIYTQVNPSVVNVTVLRHGAAILPEGNHPPGIEPDDFFPASSGSGFVWSEDGYIVTNNHVVEDADEVQITFSDGTVAIAEVVGTDRDSDLAVLRIDPDGYNVAPIQIGHLEDVYVGMRVAAIGNPFGLEGTLTSGIVSAIGRSIPARENFSIPDSIQTDAAINPGNSGGPLLNEHGELIGINAQIRSDVRSNSGVGFAIPVNVVARVVPAIIETGEYEHSYMGVSGGTFSPLCAEDLGLPKILRGALVGRVLSNTPASRAGLRGGDQPSGTHYPGICPEQAGGDLITAINAQSVTTFDDILSYLQRNTSPGDIISLTIWRDGEEYLIDLTLAPRPRSVTP